MSWKDQSRRRRAAEKRGRRGTRRAGAMLLRSLVVHPVDLPDGLSGVGATGFVVDDPATGSFVIPPAFLEDEDTAL